MAVVCFGCAKERQRESSICIGYFHFVIATNRNLNHKMNFIMKITLNVFVRNLSIHGKNTALT